MKSPPFAYAAASSADEAVDLLAEHGDEARVLAGGQSLVPLMNQRLLHPQVLVDTNGAGDLAGIEVADGELRIGAMVRQQALLGSPEVREHAPLLAEAARHVAHVAVRHRGTIGGSLAFGDPSAELPAAAMALDASVVVRSANGEREVAVADLYTGAFATVLAPDELVTQVRVPLADGPRGSGFSEVARRVQDSALGGAAVTLSLNGGSTIAHARVALCGAGDTPLRLTAVESALQGAATADVDPAALADGVADGLEPLPSVHGSSRYRARVAGVVTRRALQIALDDLDTVSTAGSDA